MAEIGKPDLSFKPGDTVFVKGTIKTIREGGTHPDEATVELAVTGQGAVVVRARLFDLYPADDQEGKPHGR